MKLNHVNECVVRIQVKCVNPDLVERHIGEVERGMFYTSPDGQPAHVTRVAVQGSVGSEKFESKGEFFLCAPFKRGDKGETADPMGEGIHAERGEDV